MHLIICKCIQVIKVVVTDKSGNSNTKQTTAGVHCFLAGTKVLTESGLKNIEDLKIGDYVYSINLDTNQKELKEIKDIYTGFTNEIYEIKVGKEIIKPTPKT